MPTMSDNDVMTANNRGRKNILVTTLEMLYIAQWGFEDPEYRLFDNLSLSCLSLAI